MRNILTNVFPWLNCQIPLEISRCLNNRFIIFKIENIFVWRFLRQIRYSNFYWLKSCWQSFVFLFTKIYFIFNFTIFLIRFLLQIFDMLLKLICDVLFLPWYHHLIFLILLSNLFIIFTSFILDAFILKTDVFYFTFGLEIIIIGSSNNLNLLLKFSRIQFI